MKEFVLLFRMDILSREAQPSKEQMDIYMKQWMQWLNELIDLGQLANGGNHLATQGRVLRSDDESIETPYVAENNSVAGYIIVSAEDIDGATQLAKKCPILNGQNTSVEIRAVAAPGY